MKSGIIGLGNPLIDLIIDVDDIYLKSNNLTKGRFHPVDINRINSMIKGRNAKILPGCSTANALVSFAQQGNEATYIGKIGDDNEGKFYENELIKEGIRPLLLHSKKPTGKALTLVTPDGERTFLVDLGASLDFNEDDVIINSLFDEINKHKIFHFTGYQIENMREAVSFILDNINIDVSFDLGDPFMVSKHKDMMLEIIKRSSVVFANKDEATELFGKFSPEELVKKLHELTKIAIVKDGINGSYIFSDRLYKIPAFKVDAVDTTGAGDMYAGVILHGIVNKMDFDVIGRKASKLAAEVCKQYGARLS